VTWHDIRPSGDPYSEIMLCIYPSKCTHTAVNTHTHTHTHTVNTHPEQWAAIYAVAPGELLGVQCLAQGHLSCGIEGEASTVHSLPPPTIPASLRLGLANFGLRVRLLTIRPRLPIFRYIDQMCVCVCVCDTHCCFL